MNSVNTLLQVPSSVRNDKPRLMWGCVTRPKLAVGVENGARMAIDVGVHDVEGQGLWRRFPAPRRGWRIPDPRRDTVTRQPVDVAEQVEKDGGGDVSGSATNCPFGSCWGLTR